MVIPWLEWLEWSHIVVGLTAGAFGAFMGFGLAACFTSGKVADLESAAFRWETQCRWLQAINGDLRAKLERRQEQEREEVPA